MGLFNLGAYDISSFCTQMKDVVQFVGYIIFIFKIAVPLLIIGYGVFDFGKAVVAEKEDEIKKQTKRLVYRLIAGIAIFLIQNIILWIFTTFVEDYSKESQSFETCKNCFLHPATKCN